MHPMSEQTFNEQNPLSESNVQSLAQVYEGAYGATTMADAEKLKKVPVKKVFVEPNNFSGFVNRGLEVDTNARLSMFEKEKIYPNEWTDSSMNLVESWLKICRDNAEKYADAARKARSMNRVLSVPTIILGTLATALSFWSAGSDPCSGDDDGDELGIKVGVAALTSGVAVLGGVNSLYSFNEKMSRCISAAGAFTNLARRIEIQVYIANHLRAQSEVVLTDFSAELASLVQHSPLL